MSWLIQRVIRQEEKTDKQSPWWFPSKATPGAYCFCPYDDLRTILNHKLLISTSAHQKAD